MTLRSRDETTPGGYPDIVRRVGDPAAAPMLLVGPNGTIALASAAAERLLGYEAGMLEGVPARRVLPRRVLAAPDGSGRTARELDVRLSRRDGGEVLAAVTLTLVPAEPGPAFLAVLRPLASPAIQTESLASAIVRSSSDAIVGKTRDGIVISWNAAACRMYGYRPEEMIGSPIGRIVPPHRRGEEQDIMRRVLSGTPVENYDTERVAKDGRLVYVSLSVAPVCDSEGEVVGFASIARDVTARRESERRTAEEGLRAGAEALENALEGIGLLDADRRYSAVNTAYAESLGCHPADLVGTPWLATIHPEDRGEIEDAFDRVRERGKVTIEVRAVRKDGTPFVAEVTLLRTGAPAPGAWYCFLKDVSRRAGAAAALRDAYERERQAAERLRALDEMKNHFLAAVSHELRTPLTSVLGYAATLEKHGDALGPVESRRMVERLRINAERLTDMLGDLLDLDRLSRGIVEPRRRRVDVSDLVWRAVCASESLHGRAISVDADPLVANVDGPKVERIIENLLTNAARHTPKDADIHVFVRREGDAVLLGVEDRGSGVPPELRMDIFQPFRHGPAAAAHSPGTGIGLSLVSRIAELHGGRAWVEGRPSGGSSFRVLLPDAPDDPRDAAV